MFSLFVTVAVLQNFEAFDASIDVLNGDSVFGKAAVEAFLLGSQGSLF